MEGGLLPTILSTSNLCSLEDPHGCSVGSKFREMHEDSSTERHDLLPSLQPPNQLTKSRSTGRDKENKGPSEGCKREQHVKKLPVARVDPQPRVGGAYLQPRVGGAYLQSSVGGAYIQPRVGGAYIQPRVGGAYIQPRVGGVYIQPSVGGAYIQPRVGGVYIQPRVGGVYIQPRVHGWGIYTTQGGWGLYTTQGGWGP